MIVDLAAEKRRQLRAPRAGENVHAHGVTIMGRSTCPARSRSTRAQMFGRNVLALLQHLFHEGEIVINPQDEITGAMLITHKGRCCR